MDDEDNARTLNLKFPKSSRFLDIVVLRECINDIPIAAVIMLRTFITQGSIVLSDDHRLSAVSSSGQCKD